MSDPIMERVRTAAAAADDLAEQQEAAVAELRAAIIEALRTGRYAHADIARAANRDPERIRQIREAAGLPKGRPGRKPRRKPSAVDE